ncbi:sugar transferase [Jannaschia marina]|uniref:sugar transferase n=1 Tax=Jannaschia marina TaxID=2741674 RepID=UPI001F300F9D|nr:sugar transferase [Jannaschia marina]
MNGPVAKRAMDVVGAALLLLFFAPVMGMIALALLACGDGPVLFGHWRVGQGGRSFRCLKFRTMHRDSAEILAACLAECPARRAEWHRTRKLKEDPRISRVGHLLRVSSLDELPQLFNVLRGEMSLVGPRPVTEEELENYGADVVHYYAAVPGITGLWQVSGRNHTTYEERVALDVNYNLNRTLMGDLRILFRTVRVVLTGHGAY